MSTLMDSVESYLTPDFLTEIASSVGENKSNIRHASTAFSASVLAGLACKANNPATINAVFLLLNNPNAIFGLDNFKELSSQIAGHQPNLNDLPASFLDCIFGAKAENLTESVASATGISKSSCCSLSGMIGPLLMGVLGKKIVTGGLSQSSFSSLLVSEKESLEKMIPPGLSSSLGISEAGSSFYRTANPPQKHRWVWPLLAGVAIVLALAFWKGRLQPEIATAFPPPADTEQPAIDNGYTKKLSSGVNIKGNAGGTEEKLIAFIESSKPVDKTTWFSFDRLLFKNNSTQLDKEKSQHQVDNIYEILKAYPAVKLKIGGYTDDVGDDDANMKLSHQRAEAVVAALTAKGIAHSRLVPEGYGSQYPVASNETAEGRAQNRRIDVRVMEK